MAENTEVPPQDGTDGFAPEKVKAFQPEHEGPAALVCGLAPAEISRAISLARITLIVGLVFIHYIRFPNVGTTLFMGVNANEHPFATWFGSAVLYFFFSAVPLLSMVSGWLFFSFKPADAWHSIRRRMKRRFVSLYLPLVAWNLFFLTGIYAFYLYNPQHEFITGLEYKLPFTDIKEWINAVFGVTHRPIGFQFWFVRDLFVTALISPFMWLALRYAPWVGAIVLCYFWLKFSHMLIFWRADVPFFFYLGALIRQKNIRLTVPLGLAISAIAAYTLLSMLRALAPYLMDTTAQNMQTHMLDVGTNLMRLAGTVGIWGVLYRAAQTPWGIRIGSYGGLAFFLHSAHWPLLVIIKTWLWKAMPGSDAAMIVNYLLTVSITVVIGLGLGNLLATKVPRFFSLMNGGRLLNQTKS